MEVENTNVMLPTNSLERLIALSDGIFAFAMTLLILGINVPRLPETASNQELVKALAVQWRELAAYVISFLNIGSYWMIHQSIFVHLSRIDRTLAQLNILFLLSVTFLPFPTALQGLFGKQSVVALIYGITIVLNYIFLITILCYSYKRDNLTGDKVQPADIRQFIIRLILPLSLAITGTVVSYCFTNLSFLLFLLVPIFNITPLNFTRIRILHLFNLKHT